MKILRIVLGGLALIVVTVVVVGFLLPREHRADREQVIATTPEELRRVIMTPAAYPEWRSGVTRVELLDAVGGKQRFVEHGDDDAITFEMEEVEPARRVVSRIADPSLPFGGTWTFELSPAEGGTKLRITEDGEVSNPVFRFVSKFVMGHHAGIDRYLGDLQRRFPARAR